METNLAPSIQLGLLSELPASESEPLGVFFLDTATQDLYVNEATGWTIVAQGSGVIGLDQVAFGNGGGGIASSPKFTYDPVTSVLTVRDSNGLILMTVDGAAADRLFSLLSAAGVSVFSFNTLTNVFSHAVPASPHYFVASTGSNTNAGTALAPLATVAEALRRLDISRWSGQPIVTVVDAVSEGANPQWIVPPPPAGALPILIQGTLVDSGLGVIAPTGGTAGTPNGAGIALPTITSFAATVANAYKRSILKFSTGTARPLAGIRAMIDSNDNAGGFVITNLLPAAPTAADPFSVLTFVGIVSYTGTLVISGIVAFDSLDMILGSGLRWESSTFQDTATRWRTLGGTPCFVRWANSVLFSNPGGFPADVTTALPLTGTTVIGAGSGWDGTAAAITFGEAFDNISGQFQMSAPSIEGLNIDLTSAIAALRFVSLGAIRTSGIIVGQTASLSINNTICGGMRKCPGSLSAAIESRLGSSIVMSQVGITGTLAGSDVMRFRGGNHQLAGVVGANPAANGSAVLTEASATVLASAGNTVTGSNPGVNDVTVGANAATIWANINGGTAPFTTDFNAASAGVATSKGCRVGP